LLNDDDPDTFNDYNNVVLPESNNSLKPALLSTKLTIDDVVLLTASVNVENIVLLTYQDKSMFTSLYPHKVGQLSRDYGLAQRTLAGSPGSPLFPLSHF
jgi:hypothetical protein